MTVRWSPEAAADFAAIVEYIRKQNPSAADRVAHRVYDVLRRSHRSQSKGAPAEQRALVNWCFRLFRLLLCTE